MNRIAPPLKFEVKCGDVDPLTGKPVYCRWCGYKVADGEPKPECSTMVNLLPEIKY